MVNLTEKITVHNADNMAIMKTFRDNEFDLAIVDPPYGIGNKLVDGGGTRNAKFDNNRDSVDWDITPDMEYFEELQRVSKNQIIWGCNYFMQSMCAAGFYVNTPCLIIWDKIQEFTGADFELAWTSFKKASKAFRMSRVEAYSKGKIHPTQKPVKLYEWLLMNYAKENDKIIDTHLGSGSIAIAIDKANTLDKKNLTFVGIEIDKDYFIASVERFNNYKRQLTIF